MKIYICENCGKEYNLSEKPDKCDCGCSDFVLIDKVETSKKCGSLFMMDEMPTKSVRDEES